MRDESEMEAAKSTAYRKWAVPNSKWEDTAFRHPQDAFETGFESGYAAAKAAWVPVSERLPEDDTPVLTSMDTAYNAVRRMYSVEIQAFCEGEWETQDVVAWQPLPKPYEALNKTEAQSQ